MGRTLFLAALSAICLSFSWTALSSAERYLNQTQEERPRKKKKVKGFDYEKSRYLSQGYGLGNRYIYQQDEPITSGAMPRKKGKKKPAPSEEGAEAAQAAPKDAEPTTLGAQQPKPAFKKMKSFSEPDKPKKGSAPAMTPEEALKAAGQAQAGGAQGGGQWQNFGPGGATGGGAGAGYGNAGNVKVMP